MSSLGTIWVFDQSSNRYVPFKPDFSAGIPVHDFNAVQQYRQTKERSPIKDNQLGIIVPLIQSQPMQSDWAQLAAVARRYPRVNTIAIVSPSQDTQGIQDFGPDAAFGNAIRHLQTNSVQVLGYIDFGTGKTTDDHKREVDNWREWYPYVNGIYFDNVPNTPFGTEVCQLVTAYAKVDRSFQLVFANLASTLSGGVVNRTDNYAYAMKGVDTFVIYEREGYLADGWYPSMKHDWMATYPRSKFAFVVYRVGNETLVCRNFIDKCVGIEKLGGYICVQAGSYPDDRRKMREWTNISPLTEVCLEQLSTIAMTEGIPSTRGVVPEKTVIDTNIGNEGGRGSQSSEHPEAVARQDIQFDQFNIRKIYPTAAGRSHFEWYLFEDNPRADTNLKNVPDLLREGNSNAWSTKDKDTNIELWSPAGRKLLNVEITGYYLPLETTGSNKFLIRQQARTGSNKGKPCEASGYIGQLMTNGTVSVIKQLQKDVYTNVRGTTQALTRPLENQWIGFKTMIYNYTKQERKDTKTYVGLELWIDSNCTDENGSLVVRNDWKPVMKMYDEGGWLIAANSKKKTKLGKCQSLDSNSDKKTRQKNEIITMAGNGNAQNNCVIWSWDSRVAFKHLSVREIERVSPD